MGEFTEREFLVLIFDELLNRAPSEYEFGYWGVVARVRGRVNVRQRLTAGAEYKRKNKSSKGQKEGRANPLAS
jgi:hypothetical protein